MVKTKNALLYSGISALFIGAIHYLSHWGGLSVPIVGLIVILATFLTAFLGMKWGDWFHG